MKFPSIQAVVKGANQTFLRFPLAILLAVVATIFSMAWVNAAFDNKETNYWVRNVIASAYLGMLLSVALAVWSKKKSIGRPVILGLQLGVVVFVGVYYFLLPDHFTIRAIIRSILYALALHWLIACIGFTRRENNGFWVFNKRLFLRILTSVLYTTVLYIGLMLALLAIETLFKVNVNPKTYAYIWCLLVGIFNTWFFLSGFPSGYESPVTIMDYPKGLKIFTQFVLLPILTVYLLILYAYLFRIVFTASWPYGWVAYLVLGFSVAGILAILLVWPLREEENNKWIGGYSRFFYFALFPLIIMLFIAIFKRVAAYGITELRYFVLLLAAWLLFVAIYFLMTKQRNIRLIPLSLCLVAFFASFGPWGAFSVSLRSQKQRLKEVMIKSKLMVDDKITGVATNVPLNNRKIITDVTKYIVEAHGYKALQPWFHQNLDSLVQKLQAEKFSAGDISDHEISSALLGVMKIGYTDRWVTEENTKAFFATSSSGYNKAISVTGYDYFFAQTSFSTKGGSDNSYLPLTYDGSELQTRLDSATNQLHLIPGKDSMLSIDLAPVINSITGEEGLEHQLPDSLRTLNVQNSQWACRLMIANFEGAEDDGKRKIKRLEGVLLLKRK